MAEYANMIIVSALMATLFFGGWQIPFASTELLRAHATTILHYAMWAFGFFSLLAGWLLVRKKQKIKYGDARDREHIVLGLPAILVGMGLLIFKVTGGTIELSLLGSQIAAAAFQFSFFLLKILFFCWVFIWVRWTLPRFRYDQLMGLGWKVFLPLALANVLVTAAVYLFL